MLALVIALTLSSNIPQQALPNPRGDAVGDIEVSGDDRQIFCIRSEQTNSSRIRRPSACRTQGEWRIIAAHRQDDYILLMRHFGAYSLDSSLLEEGAARAQANYQQAQTRTQRVSTR